MRYCSPTNGAPYTPYTTPLTYAYTPLQVRYCSPTNGASSLTPEAFKGYLREPWYAVRVMARG